MAEVILGTGNRPAPSTFDQIISGKVPGVVTTTTDQLFGMARKSSLWRSPLASLLRHRNDVYLHGASRL